MSPEKLQSLIQNGLAHHRAGRLAEAETLYRQARLAAPRNFDVLHLSGLVAFQQARFVEAIELLTGAHHLDPRHAVCQMRLGLACMRAGRGAEAEQHLRGAVRQKPDLAEGWDNLAYHCKANDRLKEAIECHEKAVAAQPDYAIGWYNYGLTLSLLGRVSDALKCHERALAVDAGCAIAHFGRAQALQQSHRVREAVEAYGTFLALKPQHHQARSFRLLALHYLEEISREQMFAEHVNFGQAVGQFPAPTFPNLSDPGRRLRVGILSPDLRSHSCAYFLEPLLRHLDRSQFEIFLYHDHFREDAVSARLRGLAKVWRNFVGQPDAAVEQAIRADAPDILVDLAGHTGMTIRLPLFARRLAPVQMTYLGYPNTTGLAAMDYRLTDAVVDPVGEADAFATERLLRFAPTAWAYQPPADAPEVSAPPCAASGVVTFGCFNNLAKIADTTLALWGAVLRAVPNSRLLLKGRGLSDPAVRERYVARFTQLGVPVERVELVERTPETQAHLALYQRVDIALDTFPYHGTTTTCEALWMGVPVVTLAGDCHMARVGVSLLNAIGHTEWIAGNHADYVRLAASLATDQSKLATIRQGLREEMRRSPLLDHAGQAARFGSALREAWMTWCTRTARAA